ncbi:putative ABC transport system permease protein [Streptomyces sp. Ag109_O5-1]|uniref:ABC transporter permease n=1 Tax=Streptomyces sp. Ag109_O5-1 TaxID=1938851 RepID=UPI000F4D6757|nr:ABC transporter permease [Streptomyces sp. Ag109_O5-1]RPE43074.1 putative ABC transport system permease protein [Streptomyces sp. Ag109_O5-1]
MSALGRVVRAGVGRRRVQTAVLVLTTLMSVTASVLAAGLLVAARAPFDHAFARQHGAHLTAQFDGTKVTAAQLTATARTSGVTATAGPFRTLSVRPRTASGSDALPAGVDLPPMTVAGRADASGRVDGLSLVSGTWATRPGQIVLAYGKVPMEPGGRLTFPDAPGSPTLTVVGVARSVTGTADAWVTPAQAGALTTPNSPSAYEMLYRFRHAGTDSQLAADRAAIRATVPKGALTGSYSYLAVKRQETANAMAFVPFLAAFGVLGLLLSVLVIGIVVSGAVGAATRRIGILKSLGFTPAQVVRAYVGQALIPAGVGCVLGLGLGNLLAVPVLGEVGTAFGGPAASIPVWVNAVVPAAALVLVAAAALVPALRAGRLRTVAAITVGRTPGVGRGRLVRRLTGRLPVPRAVSLGLANPCARPARSATTAAAVAFGAAAVTFGVGLALTLGAVQSGRMLNSAGQVVVEAGGGQGPAGAQVVHAGGESDIPKADPAKVAAVLRAQRGTGRFYGTAQAEAVASGITGTTTVVAYQGESSWGAPQLVSGRWLYGPGQAVVTTRFLKAAGLRVGDTVTLTERGRRTSVRIVGEAFFTEGEGMALLTPTSTLAALGLDAKPGQYHVQTKPGTALAPYLTSLNTALGPVGAVARANTSNASEVIATMDALVGTLTLMLVVVAGLGVLNTVVLDTRDRVHDLGVLKALGMAPRQTVTMVLTSVAGIGLLAGVAAVPAGVALHRLVTPLMGDAVGMTLPASDIAVYHAPQLALLALGGLLIAATGAFLPAGWAARSDTATALRSE